MQIKGFYKTTLLDYPNKIAATIFTSGCNFCCPFCHNQNLVTNIDHKFIDQDEILHHLSKRKGILQGICISGGEPTLQKDLKEFIEKVKSLGYLVKLDTNGTNPIILENLLELNLLDYIAMDIKNSKEKYSSTCGIEIGEKILNNIDKSISLLINSNIAHEFRTTVCQELHTIEDLKIIGEWIKGAHAYYLQPYRESTGVISKCYSSYSNNELQNFKNIVALKLPNTYLRGVE